MQVCAALRAARSGSAKTAAVSSVSEETRADGVGGDAVARPGLGHGAGQLRRPRPWMRHRRCRPGKARCDCSEAKFTIRPQPFSFIAGTMCCAEEKRHGQVEAIVTSQPSGVTASAASRVLMPAAWTRMSGAPKGSAIAARGRPARRGRPHRGATRHGLPGPRLCQASASARRATPTTLAPARLSTSAARRPRPELAPVTQATRPGHRKGGSPSPQPSAVRSKFRRGNTSQPHIGGAGMPLHAFEPGDARRGLGHGLRALAGGALPGDDLHVFVHAEAARVAPRRRSAARGWCPMPCRHRPRSFPRPGTASRSRTAGRATSRDPRPARSGARARIASEVAAISSRSAHRMTSA
jgi:hypothetical protein